MQEGAMAPPKDSASPSFEALNRKHDKTIETVVEQLRQAESVLTSARQRLEQSREVLRQDGAARRSR